MKTLKIVSERVTLNGAFLVVTDGGNKSIKDIAKNAVLPGEWPTNSPSRIFIDPITKMLMPMGLSWSEPG